MKKIILVVGIVMLLLVSGCKTLEIKDRFELCNSLGYETTLLATDYTNDFYCVNIGDNKTIIEYQYINWSVWR